MPLFFPPVSFQRFAGLVLGLGVLAGCSSSRPPDQPAPPEAIDEAAVMASMPAAPREFRAAWIATVANIDWPSQPGLPTVVQQAELRALLDRAVLLNLNAVVFQVRPTADAFYESPYEPWSYYLTGEQGRAPEPYYDPLAFAVEEAHRRGLELHTWFNPYRAAHPTTVGRLAETHINNTHPELVKRYGDQLWLDPGEPEARDHSIRVMMDVVRRYDIDGVHMDDYFYPYAIEDADGNDVSFPDSASWARARAGGETRSLSDWRRSNVDVLIERLYFEIKQLKPWVKFGISPFGIWRPGYPPEVTGFDAYEGLYADARKWFQNGWVDYFTPQLYWRIASEGQSYPALLGWWAEQNTSLRHLWPGNYASRVFLDGDRRWEPGEILEQIRVTRATPGASGNVHFSMKALMPRPELLGTQLARTVYARPALVPASPWLGGQAPGQPIAQLHDFGSNTAVTMRPQGGGRVWLWVVRTYDRGTWTTDVVPGWQQTYPLGPVLPALVVVSAVDRTGLEGPVTIARLGADAVVD